MQRWIVAGGVLALLVGMIVYDEYGGTDTVSSPEVAIATPAGAGEDGVVQPDMASILREGEEAPEPEPEVIDHGPVTGNCDKVIAVLTEHGSEVFMKAVGDALIDGGKMTVEQLDALCVSVENAPADEIVAKLSAASGVAP